jgi:hypothetical protein
MGFSTNFPAIKPTLLLDFANTKALDPRITFTRATTATFYDGVTTAMAEQNLLLYSQEFDNAAWTNSVTGVAAAPIVTANQGAAPDGFNTADRIQFSLSGGTSSSDITRRGQNFVGASGIPYTFSIWVKSFDGVSNYTMHIISPTGATTMVDVTGTWNRVSVTANASGSSVGYGIGLRGGMTPTNSNTADILVWGAQLEQRSSVTAYTATTTQAITNYIPVLQTAASGVPRFDHNPITDESLGLLIEEQRTNLLTYSEQFDNAAWSKIRTSITANNIVAPDGTLTGDVLIENTDNNSHVVLTTVASQAAGTYTYSVYAKANGRTSFILQNTVTTTYGVLFDLSAVTATTNAGGATGTITHVGNGWYRCTATFTTATNIALSFSIQLISGGAGVYTGNGFSGIFLWGAQLEAGAFPTSYIPTVAASVTRNADAASMTGTNFSSWYSAAEGTIYGEASSATSNNGAIAVASDGTTANSFSIGHNGTSTTANINTNGSLQANFPSLGTWNINTFAKIAMAVGVNNSNAALNGSLGTTDTSCLMPVVNRMDIGSWVAVSSVQPINGTIKKIAYYPIRVTNAHLQGLTTV